jgi:High-temperature-induced dauer-formation protein
MLTYNKFWELPETPEDVFTLFSSSDIRRTRDNSLANLETLILAITSRLVILRHHPSFPDLEIAPERDALNCIRVLTRILPFLYEADQLSTWEETFFWGVRRKRTREAQIRPSEVLFDETAGDDETTPTPNQRRPEADYEDAKPLAEELIDTLVDMLFFADFTLPRVANAKSKVSYAIWQTGVGCNTPVGTSKEYESNRSEILRLLLTLTSRSMYLSASEYTIPGWTL